ncbi:MAG: hypothetical protein J7L94_15240 [Caldisericaceae bacterium]|nr:hypothetical protein [Caldisericaceae bacterium]
MIKLSKLFFLCFTVFALFQCKHETLSLPNIPPDEPKIVGNEYIQLNTKFDKESGYNFKAPGDIYIGADNFLYLADTGNDRIVMMDLGGSIMGYSKPIPHPEAITQNDSLALLIVNKTNRIYKIDLVKHQHQINQATVEVVFEMSSEPTRQFTGISVHNGFEYYVTVVDSTVSPVLSQIYDFYGNNVWKGPLPLYSNGSGLFSALIPTGITSLREQYLDISSKENTLGFIFCQSGSYPPANLFNYYKVQYITTTLFEGQEVLTPKTDLSGTPEENYLYYFNKFYLPEDVALDYSGNIFVVDAGSPDGEHLPGFYRFGPTGQQQQAVVGYGSGDYQFKTPKGIAVTRNSDNQTVYVSDTGNNRILQFKLSRDL